MEDLEHYEKENDRDPDDTEELYAVVPRFRLLKGSHASGGGCNLYRDHRIHSCYQPDRG